MKQFKVPIIYRSPLITAIKKKRRQDDRLKKDFSPTRIDLGPLQIFLARHFGFCYGVENAIEIAFRTVEENPGKQIYLLSEMIHNPHVNEDLLERGVRFLQDTRGMELIPLRELQPDDIVIIPAFGTTLDLEQKLRDIGLQTEKYNTTCPFVEKVWNRSESIAGKGYTVIVHGKPGHEETRATFSHSAANAPTVVVKDMDDAITLSKFITGETEASAFYHAFKGKYSQGFNAANDLHKIGVVNQTTMLASDTQAIADFLKMVMMKHYHLNEDTIVERFADTRDTLCYATNDNQTAVTVMLDTEADLAIVIGGYNSSNTSHLVELCEERIPTYFISSDDKIIAPGDILHYQFRSGTESMTGGFLPAKPLVRILLTSGASCPDALVEGVMKKLAACYGVEKKMEELIDSFQL